MCHIPDPLEIMENNIERMMDSFDGNCMKCGKKVDYELIPLSDHPYAPAVCIDCLPPVTKNILGLDEQQKGA